MRFANSHVHAWCFHSSICMNFFFWTSFACTWKCLYSINGRDAAPNTFWPTLHDKAPTKMPNPFQKLHAWIYFLFISGSPSTLLEDLKEVCTVTKDEISQFIISNGENLMFSWKRVVWCIWLFWVLKWTLLSAYWAIWLCWNDVCFDKT